MFNNVRSSISNRDKYGFKYKGTADLTTRHRKSNNIYTFPLSENIQFSIAASLLAVRKLTE